MPQINPVTIVSQLRELAIPEGEWLCQTVATSVLGRQMIALAKHKGLKTVNIVRRQEAKQEILDIGYVHSPVPFLAVNP